MLYLAGTIALFLILWVLFIPAGPVLQHLLAALAKRTASFRYGDYVVVFALVAVGLAVTIVSANGFLDIAEEVHEQNPELQQFDARIHRWAELERSSGATTFFTVTTNMGSPVGLALIVAIVAIPLLVNGRYRWAAYLLLTTGIGALLVIQLKVYFARARPDLAVALRHAQGYSFPSGHAMGTTICCLALSYLAVRTKTSRRLKAAALAALTTFALAVSFSRIYLGVHWVSDVGAGLVVGTLWVTITTVAYETVRRIRMVRAIRAKRRQAVT